MLFPFLRGILNYNLAPLTWTICIVNVLFFFTTGQVDVRSQKIISEKLTSEESLKVSGRLYSQYKDTIGKSKDQKNIQDRASNHLGENELLVLGSQALRDKNFLGYAIKTEFNGDQVVITNWKKNIEEYLNIVESRFSSVFGLKSYTDAWPQWVTYQFVHGGFVHLISNMIVLLIFGSAVEFMLGSYVLLFVYIAGGIVSGFSYLYFAFGDITPVVGASGAVSAIMAFYALSEKKKYIKFFYFVSPAQGYYGFVYLPAYLILPLSFLPDLAAFISTPEEYSAGIAYTAHIGGAVFGVLMAVVLRSATHLFRWGKSTT